MLNAGMSEPKTRKIYNVQSHFYDWVGARMIRRRQSNAVARMNIKPGDTVLDIGVGTGLSLELYPPRCRVLGIDISEGMLGKADERMRHSGMKNVSLVRADAMLMPFADNTFDHILVSHVITVVSDPRRLLDHIKRVGKPGCRIVIINHFQSGYRALAWLERILVPVCVHLGWRSDLNLHELLQGVHVDVEFRYKIRSFDLWEIVFLRNSKPRLVSYERAMQRTPALADDRHPYAPAQPAPARL